MFHAVLKGFGNCCHINSLGVTIINGFDEHYGCFDFIWVNQVLEHLSDPLGVLINLQKCLTTTGKIYIGVPDCKNIKKILKENGLSKRLFKLLSPHQHINAFGCGSNGTNQNLNKWGRSALSAFALCYFLARYPSVRGLSDLNLKNYSPQGFVMGHIR